MALEPPPLAQGPQVTAASAKLECMINQWAQTASARLKARDLIQEIEVQASKENLNDEFLRSLLESALRSRTLSERQILRLLPSRLKNPVKRAAGMTKKISADKLSAETRNIIPIERFNEIRKLIDLGQDFAEVVRGKTVVKVEPLLQGNSKIELVECAKNTLLYNEICDRHYVPNRGVIGNQIHYLIYVAGKRCGAIRGSSSVWSVKARDSFFGITKSNRLTMIQQIVNNSLFRLETHEKNLASQVLAIWRKKIAFDWQKKYGVNILGFETFVCDETLPFEGGLQEKSLIQPQIADGARRRTGGIYKADNWSLLGTTKGDGKHVTSRESTVIRDARRDGKRMKFAEGKLGYISRYKTPKKVILCRWAGQKKRIANYKQPSLHDRRLQM